LGGDWLPPFASGRIAGSYKLLRRYLESAREMGRVKAFERALLGEEDYRLLRRIAVDGASVWDVVERLASIMEERVDPEVAVEALRREGVEATPETARRIIARLLAAWLVEAGEYWRIVGLEGRWL
jgi:hypothetical protein